MLLLGVLGVAVSSACNTQPPAATVNGHKISSETIHGDLAAEVKAGTSSYRGQGDGTWTIQSARTAINRRVLDALVTQALQQRKVRVPADGATQVLQTCRSQAAQSGQKCALDAYKGKYRQFLLDSQARVDALQRALPGRSAAELQAAARVAFEQMLAQAADQTEICLELAGVTDAASADAIRNQVASGGDFAGAVNAQPSAQLLQGSRCFLSGLVPPEVALATVGQVVGPLQAQSGDSLVAHVLSRSAPRFEDFEADLVAGLRQQDQSSSAGTVNPVLQKEINKLITAARITVDPRFGGWNKRTGVVVPPLPKGVKPAGQSVTLGG